MLIMLFTGYVNKHLNYKQSTAIDQVVHFHFV